MVQFFFRFDQLVLVQPGRVPVQGSRLRVLINRQDHPHRTGDSGWVIRHLVTLNSNHSEMSQTRASDGYRLLELLEFDCRPLYVRPPDLLEPC
jgi:hypothetical protein